MHIEVLNDEHYAEAQAEAIAKHYNTSYEKMEDGLCRIKGNDKLAHAFGDCDDMFMSSCQEVSKCTGVTIYPDDILLYPDDMLLRMTNQM